MDKKYHVRERAFLNLHSDMRAYVIGIVEDAREKHVCCGRVEDGPEITLRIADCYEEIDLYFDIRTTEERENSLYKIRKLAEVINAVQRAIDLEVEVINARQTGPLQHARAAGMVH